MINFDVEDDQIKLEKPYQDWKIEVVSSYTMIKFSKGRVKFYLSAYDDQLSFTTTLGKEYASFDEIRQIGDGRFDRFATGRGYIWSRTLPIVLEKPLLGYGGDTFALYFPQNDLLGKANTYNTFNMYVDKPHNMYLQMVVNFGFGNTRYISLSR